MATASIVGQRMIPNASQYQVLLQAVGIETSDDLNQEFIEALVSTGWYGGNGSWEAVLDDLGIQDYEPMVRATDPTEAQSPGSAPSAEGAVSWGVIYLGGFDGIPPRPGGLVRQSWHWGWTVHVSATGVVVKVKENKMTAPTVDVASQGWDKLRGVFFEPAHSTSNPLAIAGFGLLGLASRIDWMGMDIRFTPEAAFASPQASANPHAAFLINLRAHDIKLNAEALERAFPKSAGKFGMLADGIRDADSASESEPAVPFSLAEELEKLAELYQDGLLSRDEFEVAKRRILDPD